jgi:pyruvate/2-oxoglutarate dehydrogenase complex dihydrolipoamide acyltransferase (E2) component
MSSAVLMPVVSDRYAEGVVTKIYRLPGHSVDVGEALVDVRVGDNVLSVGSNRDGFVYRILVAVGQKVRAGDYLAEVGGWSVTHSHVIFIGYRQSDAPGHTGRIYDRLSTDFGHWQVFRDVGSLVPGRNYVEQVQAALKKAKVGVVVIGPNWLAATNPTTGVRRLDNPDDLHRIELAILLGRNVPIIPALVTGAQMPSRTDLPADIKALADMQAVSLSDERWDYDYGRLHAAITKILSSA